MVFEAADQRVRERLGPALEHRDAPLLVDAEIDQRPARGVGVELHERQVGRQRAADHLVLEVLLDRLLLGDGGPVDDVEQLLAALRRVAHRLQDLLELGRRRRGLHQGDADGGRSGDRLRELAPALRIAPGESLHLLDGLLRLPPHGDRLALGAQVDVSRVDQPLPEAVPARQPELVVDRGGSEEGGVNRSLVDQVVGRLGSHRVRAREPAGRLALLDDQHVDAGLCEIARGDEPVVPGADDDHLRAAARPAVRAGSCPDVGGDGRR